MYPLYLHESMSTQEPCICAQEKHSVDVHTQEYLYLQSIHTNSLTINISRSTNVYIACSLSRYYTHPVILAHTLPDTALISPVVRV